MKIIKTMALAFVMGLAFTACNDPAESYEADDERLENTRGTEVDNERGANEDDEGSGLDVGVSVDEEGDVDGEAEGNIEIDEDDNR